MKKIIFTLLFAVSIGYTFAQTYNVTTVSQLASGGTTTGDGTYASGATVTVNATPNTGYNFISWTNPQGTVLSTNQSYIDEL